MGRNRWSTSGGQRKEDRQKCFIGNAGGRGQGGAQGVELEKGKKLGAREGSDKTHTICK